MEKTEENLVQTEIVSSDTITITNKKFEDLTKKLDQIIKENKKAANLNSIDEKLDILTERVNGILTRVKSLCEAMDLVFQNQAIIAQQIDKNGVTVQPQNNKKISRKDSIFTPQGKL